MTIQELLNLPLYEILLAILIEIRQSQENMMVMVIFLMSVSTQQSIAFTSIQIGSSVCEETT